MNYYTDCKLIGYKNYYTDCKYYYDTRIIILIANITRIHELLYLLQILLGYMNYYTECKY